MWSDVALTECGDGQDLRDIAFGERAEVFENRILMSWRHRAPEQQDVRRLAVHRDDRRIGGRHHHQLDVDLRAYQLAKAVGLGRIRLDCEQKTHASRPKPDRPIPGKSVMEGFSDDVLVGRRRSDSTEQAMYQEPNAIVKALNPLLLKRPSVSPPMGASVSTANR